MYIQSPYTWLPECLTQCASLTALMLAVVLLFLQSVVEWNRCCTLTSRVMTCKWSSAWWWVTLAVARPVSSVPGHATPTTPSTSWCRHTCLPCGPSTTTGRTRRYVASSTRLLFTLFSPNIYLQEPVMCFFIDVQRKGLVLLMISVRCETSRVLERRFVAIGMLCEL